MDSLFFSLSCLATVSMQWWKEVSNSSSSATVDTNTSQENAYSTLIGNTPLVELGNLSRILGRRILVKMESMNPGGTGKDRAAKFMINEAFTELQDKKVAVEGTSGSTGIALAYLCRSYGEKKGVEVVPALYPFMLKTRNTDDFSPDFACTGFQLHVFIPDDQAEEKKQLLEKLGAVVSVQRCCSISNRDHYVNVAKRYAVKSGGVFMDQFENLANYKAHYTTTGPEIWKQTRGKVDCFVMSAGTGIYLFDFLHRFWSCDSYLCPLHLFLTQNLLAPGGTIAGISNYLKEQTHGKVEVVLADPPGSSLFNRVEHGVCFTNEQSERKLKKHRYDTIAEGIGLDRLTANFNKAKIDRAIRVEDQEALDMAHWLLANEGLFVGSSSAMNIVAACRSFLTLCSNIYEESRSLYSIFSIDF